MSRKEKKMNRRRLIKKISTPGGKEIMQRRKRKNKGRKWLERQRRKGNRMKSKR